MAGWKAGPPASRMVANQLCLCFGMRDADIVIGQQIGAPEQFGFMRPVGAEAVKQPAERWMRPGRRMDTVGDRPNRIAREHAGGGLLMALRHPVDIAGEVEGKARHVERVIAAETPQSRGIDKVSEEAADQIVIEPVMARVDRSMGREHTPLAHRLQVVRECALGAGGRLRIAPQEGEREQRRMALIQVIGGDLETERTEEHFPADAEDDFLLKPQRCIPAVKAAGDGAVIRIVLGDIRIEQQDRHRAARRALQNMQPRADPDRPLDNRHSHHSGQGTSPKLRIPWILYISLATGRVQFLPEIARPADQGDENDWQIEIGRRAGRITGEDAEPAAIGRHFRSDRDFHREVGYPGSAHEAVMVDVSA